MAMCEIEFLEALEWAHETFASGTNGCEPDGGRLGMCFTLGAVIEHLIHHLPETHQRFIEPLWALKSALYDLEDGHVMPPLQKRPVRHRPQERSVVALAKAQVLYSIDLLKSAGRSDASATAVAIDLAKRSALLGNITKEEILSWRRHARRESSRLGFWYSFFQTAGRYPGVTIEQEIEDRIVGEVRT